MALEEEGKEVVRVGVQAGRRGNQLRGLSFL